MMTKRKVILGLVAIFVAGVVVGTVGGMMAGKRDHKPPPPPQQMAQHIAEKYKSKLSLSPEQFEKIVPIIQRTTERVDELRCESTEQIAATIKASNVEISAHLNPDQKAALQAWERERQESFRNKQGKPCDRKSSSRKPGEALK